MLPRIGLFSLGSVSRLVLTRNIGMTVPCMQVAATATDPIQKLFIDKIRDYANKSKSAGGKLVDATAETEKQLKDELEKLARQFGAKDGVDFNKFPVFSFVDPTLEPVGLNVDTSKVKVQKKEEEVAEVEKKEEEDKAWFEL